MKKIVKLSRVRFELANEWWMIVKIAEEVVCNY
jgi:hypothetical protein